MTRRRPSPAREHRAWCLADRRAPGRGGGQQHWPRGPAGPSETLAGDPPQAAPALATTSCPGPQWPSHEACPLPPTRLWGPRWAWPETLSLTSLAAEAALLLKAPPLSPLRARPGHHGASSASFPSEEFQENSASRGGPLFMRKEASSGRRAARGRTACCVLGGVRLGDPASVLSGVLQGIGATGEPAGAGPPEPLGPAAQQDAEPTRGGLPLCIWAGMVGLFA